MCGIVGLLVKKPALKQQLGQLMVPMLIEGSLRIGWKVWSLVLRGEPFHWSGV